MLLLLIVSNDMAMLYRSLQIMTLIARRVNHSVAELGILHEH